MKKNKLQLTEDVREAVAAMKRKSPEDRSLEEQIMNLKHQVLVARKHALAEYKMHSLTQKYMARQKNRLEFIAREHNISMDELVKGVY